MSGNGKGRKVRLIQLAGPAIDTLRAYKHGLRPTREPDTLFAAASPLLAL